jgi:hypothetical protein
MSLYLPSRGSQKKLHFDIMFFVTGLTYYLMGIREILKLRLILPLLNNIMPMARSKPIDIFF